MELVRHIYNCDGILVGYIVRNEHGGSFFVQRGEADQATCLNYGVNAKYITPEVREAFRNQGATALRRAFA